MAKLPDFGTTIFSVMSQLAQEHGAINLSQGFPDYQPDIRLIEQLKLAVESGSHQYPVMAGLLELREQISSSFEEKFGKSIDPVHEITITAGATQAIYTTIATFVSSGDEVLLMDPSYDSYSPSVLAQGAIPVRIPSYGPEFITDWDRVSSCITPRTRLLIFNNPNNPTGRVFAKQDLDILAEIAVRNNVIVLSDEVYEGIVFEPLKHHSVLCHPGLEDRSIAVFSFGKTYHITGWKIGFCMSSPALMHQFRNLHQFLVFSVNSIAQQALANYMKFSESRLPLANAFKNKRDYLNNGLVSAGFKVLPSEGTYFQVADYSEIRPDLSEVEFCRWLTIKYGVASIPLMPFYEGKNSQNLVRFCFAKKDKTLASAVERLAQIRFLD